MEHYPKWLFGLPDASGVCPQQLVKDEAEHNALEGDWFEHPDDAKAAAGNADELTAARADAEKAGVKVDSRWGVKRVRAEIEKAAKP